MKFVREMEARLDDGFLEQQRSPDGKVVALVDQLVDKAFNAKSDSEKDSAALALFRKYGICVYPY